MFIIIFICFVIGGLFYKQTKNILLPTKVYSQNIFNNNLPIQILSVSNDYNAELELNSLYQREINNLMNELKRYDYISATYI